MSRLSEGCVTAAMNGPWSDSGDAPRVLGGGTLDVGGERDAVCAPAVRRRRRSSASTCRPWLRRDRVARGEAAGAQVQSGIAAPAIDAGPGRDLDAALPHLMELGGKRVTADDDARNLIARRQAPAGEAVDANRGARARRSLRACAAAPPDRPAVDRSRPGSKCLGQTAAGFFLRGRHGDVGFDVGQRQRRR